MMLSRRSAGNSFVCSFNRASHLACKPPAIWRTAPFTAVRQRAGRITIKAQQKDPEGPLGLRGSETLALATLFAPNGKEMLKANVALPPSQGLPKTGDQVRVRARGVVLFMHGFVQDPTAYARMLNQLAADDVVVIAPCPPNSGDPLIQQTYMVQQALFWRDLIASNKLPDLELLDDTSKHVGLLAHSVGGGLAPYVAGAAAQRGHSFTGAQVMAPMTWVVDKYRYDKANDGKVLQGVDTEWGVQYGLLDLLSFAFIVEALCAWLRRKHKLKEGDTVKYPLGTHVGFEDQLVVGPETSFVGNVLPWLLAVLLGPPAIFLPGVVLGGLSKQRGGVNLRAAAPPQDQQQALQAFALPPVTAGFNEPDRIQLPDERAMYAGYILLAAAIAAIGIAIPGFKWDSPYDIALSIGKGVVLILEVFALPALAIYPYEATKQRPEARRRVVEFFRNYL